MSAANAQSSCDVIIAGGGIAGLTLACALGDSALQVAVLDKTAWPPAPDAQSALRVSAITPASQQVFARCHSWRHIPAEKIAVFKAMRVWTSTGGAIHFNADEINRAVLGYIIENDALQTALYKQLTNYANVTMIAPAQLKTINIMPDAVEVTTDAATLTAHLLVGADGAHSQVRELSRFAIDERPYQHTSIIATAATELPHKATAWQCFSDKGIVALLPLPDPQQCSIVWSTAPALADDLLNKNDREFGAALTALFGKHLGKIHLISARKHFPLQRRHAQHYIKANVALIGDAAHTVHPLAGQGLNLGILDADYLAKVILTAHSKKQALGALPVLRRYERARKADNSLMFAVIDTIKYLFSAESAALKFFSNAGFAFINKSGLLKRFLIKQAAGLSEHEDRH